jgi:ribose transport system substrate-binding protein
LMKEDRNVRKVLSKVGVAMAGVIMIAACGGSSATTAQTKYKIALSMSYTGNDWQDDAANLVKAEAATPPYKSLVDLRVDVAGTEITKQIQTINNEVAAGMNALIVYPLSPTALNPTIQAACKRGVVVFAYDSLIGDSCAYNIHTDITDLGRQGALWLAQQMHAKGLHNVALITGVSGTSADSEELQGVQDALKGYPDLHVVARASGNWDQGQIKTAFASEMAAHPEIQGVWGITGCQPVQQVLQSLGKPLILCAGGGTNAERSLMLPPSQGGVSAPDTSIGVQSYSGELALMYAVKVLQGNKVAKDTILPTINLTADKINMGVDPAVGANVYAAAAVPPGFFDDFWGPLVDQGLQAALHGQSAKVSSAQPCSAVPGCREQDGLTYDALHPGGN